MQRLEVSGAVRPLYRSLGVKGLIYRVMQEGSSIFWEAIGLVIVKEKVNMNMCLILNGYRARAV